VPRDLSASGPPSAVQWGKPIGKHEAIAHKLADMAATTFAMEAIADLATAMADRGNYDIRLEAAAAKEWNTFRGWEIVDETMQIRGGRGYETERSLAARGEEPIGVERMMRDYRINKIFEGSSEIMHLFMAREAVDKHLEVAGAILDPKKSGRRRRRPTSRDAALLRRLVPDPLGRLGPWPRFAEFGALAGHLRLRRAQHPQAGARDLPRHGGPRAEAAEQAGVPLPHRRRRQRAVRDGRLGGPRPRAGRGAAPGGGAVPGLECAGEVAVVGPAVEGWSVGDRAMALLAGGGHAERVAVPAGQLLALPPELSWAEGAAVPEVGVTAWTNLVVEGGVAPGETVLITAAASGVGTFAVQLARELGARPLVAGRSRERLAALVPLGAAGCVELGPGLPDAVRELTGGRGADLVLDLVGGEVLPLCLAALADRGRLVLVGLLGGGRATLDLASVLRRRLRLVGSVLRSRSRAEKAELVAAFGAFALPRLADGRLRPVVDRVLPFAEIAAAYEALAAGGVLGKIVLEV
jgi:NADPH:quinone reductase-like Zn-dependent oxidoreductase